MSGDELFDGLPESASPRAAGAGKPRLREPVRDQIELQAVDTAFKTKPSSANTSFKG